MENKYEFKNSLPQFFKIIKFVNKKKQREDRNKPSISYRLIYVISGSMQLETESKTYSLSSGDIFYMPPDTIYATCFKDDLEIFNIFFGYKNFLNPGEVIGYKSINIFCNKLEFTDFPEFSECHHILNFNNIHLIEELFNAASNNDIIQGLNLNRIFYNILHAVIKSIKLPLTMNNKVILSITEYVQNNITELLSCKEIARHFSYHPNYINRLFKQNFKISFHDYIVKQKVLKGAKLLLETDLSITQIASRLSFYDSSHFTEIFSKITGKTPSAYRKFYV